MKLAWRALGKWSKLLSLEKWNIGIAPMPIAELAHIEYPRDVRWLDETDDDRYRADPFGVTIDGRSWVFAENFDFNSGVGTIEALPVEDGRWFGKPVPALDLRGHLSYPFVFAIGGQAYCIPETLENNEIALYRAVDFPAKWQKEATLVQGFAGVDATPLFSRGRWWLFTTENVEPRHHRLHVFYSDELRGPYSPHALNPVKVDPRSAGGAGTPFFVDDAVYRPAQDCSRGYGGAVVINRIITLTPKAFAEETVARLDPRAGDRYRLGIHTISALGDITLVDGKRRAPTLRRVIWRTARAARRLLRIG
jgi:hypothetical protein